MKRKQTKKINQIKAKNKVGEKNLVVVERIVKYSQI